MEVGGGIFLAEGNRDSGINSSQKESLGDQPLTKTEMVCILSDAVCCY